MEKLSGHDIRRQYLKFFETKGHTVLPSASLVPVDDPTLLWINCGMAPLKPFFDGRVPPPNPRLASSQKSLRTNDIENVGRTPRHQTFFEMLGNFSIGDYFKEEAIVWAWEFVTEWLRLPVEKLWVTVHPTDDEARQIWYQKIGLPMERIVDDPGNFWDIGPGPCGPNSEIYIDRGERFGCGQPDCKPSCDCSRYLEFWNLVFTQYNHNEDGSRILLPKKNIDTGMGLERIASIVQDVDTNFETDLFWPLVEQGARIAGVNYVKDGKVDMALHLIADHIRAATFAIADGVSPSNEGRGYVIRRLLRRAARYGRVLGVEKPFLHTMVSTVVSLMKEPYPEVKERQDFVTRVILSEEERFLAALTEGTHVLGEVFQRMAGEKRSQVSGKEAFLLYDTYGFPLDLTMDMAAEKGFTVDQAGFEREMEAQRERARAARKETEGWEGTGLAAAGLDQVGPSRFNGYDRCQNQSRVMGMVIGGQAVDSITEGDEAAVILEETPFYAASGGQVADMGLISAGSGEFHVADVCRLADGKIWHVGRLVKGSLNVGAEVTASVDEARRQAIARNHSATHLVHQALRQVLGDHVHQAGSLVEPGRLRFDFSHFQPVTPEEIRQIEDIVNRQILADLEVEAEETTLEEARQRRVIALFGEKYGDRVRVVSMGNFSLELCGGTHVRRTGEIGLLKIISEIGIGSGLRRLEAVTGAGFLEYLRQREELIERSAEALKTKDSELPGRIAELLAANKALTRELEQERSKSAKAAASDLLSTAVEVAGAKVLAARVEVADMDGLRSMGDLLRDKLGSGIVVLGAVSGDKVNLVAMVTPDLVKRGGHAGNLIKEVAGRVGGGGGGRPDMAQAGGREPEKLAEALAAVAELVSAQLGRV